MRALKGLKKFFLVIYLENIHTKKIKTNKAVRRKLH